MVQDEFSECENNNRLDGKVALVTGATTGVGLEVAKNLAQRGAKVIIASRHSNRLKTAQEEIIKASSNNEVVARQMDFESLKSIRNLVAETVSTEPRLDILVNNIGAIGLEDKLTEDGLHVMMQVNYFGMFLLTYLLFPLLKSSAPSRIVNVSSLASILGDVNLDHWNDVGRYSSFGYYSNAKLMTILFTAEMERRIKGSKVSVYSMDPGLTQTRFLTKFPPPYSDFWNTFLFILGRPLHRTALMYMFLSVDTRVEGKSGRHFRDCKEYFIPWHANDTNFTRRLWDESKKLVRIAWEEDWEKDYHVKLTQISLIEIRRHLKSYT